jgi:signal transduction histidine kinase
VGSTLALVRHGLKEDSIRTEVDVPDALPPLRARGHELQQVLEKLVANARDALNARFPRWDDEKVLRIAVRAEGTRARIEVRDQGCGIAARNLERVFDPFFTTREGALGLGLTTAKRIVTEHGGAIAVESEEGLWTAVVVELPVWP